jgi:hypothetical protein
MLKKLFIAAILLGFFPLVSRVATAQEIVHALVGTVSSIDAEAKTITVATDDGSDGTFHDLTDAHAAIKFDKSLRNDSTAASEFKSQAARVIVYYYGAGSGRTAVALKDLGTGPFTTSTGTFVKFDKKERSLSIKDKTGAILSFTIAAGAIAETDGGVTEAIKFDPRKGIRINVLSTSANGNSTAVFINGALEL